MIGQAKPLASLSSSLLARKGTARPAMRPQGFGGFGSIPSAHDDLGWNDMGEPHEVHTHEAQYDAPVPPVLMQRELLSEEFEAPLVAPTLDAEPLPTIDQVLSVKPVRQVEIPVEPRFEPAPAPVVAVTPVRAARIARETTTKQAKAAFTLRLDHDRHLSLRLASALKNRSAQQLVTEALDAFLDTLPEVAALTRQLPAGAPR